MQLSRPRDDVLPALLDHAQHHRVRLRQPLQPLHQLRQVRRVLALHRHPHHRRHRKLHRPDRVRVRLLLPRQRRILRDELVQSHHRHRVPARHVLHRLLPPPHPDHRPLHRLRVQVLLPPGHVVRPHDPHLHSRRHLPREHAPEREKPPLVRRRNHLRHVQHQRAVRVAVPDRVRVLVVQRPLVQILHPVPLRRRRRRQMVNHHLQQRARRRQPRLHRPLHQRLPHQVLLVRLQPAVQLRQHRPQLLLLVVHADVDHLLDRVVHELHEPALARRRPRVLRRPLLRRRVEKVLPPQPLHHLLLVHPELPRVHLREVRQRERPPVQTRRKRHRPLLRIHLHVPQQRVLVRRHDHVRALDHPLERLVRLLALHLQLQKAPVHLVHSQHRPDPLSQCLPQHRLRLHAHSLHAVHHHQSSVRDPQRRRHLRRKVHMPGRVDQVDQVIMPVLLALVVLQRLLRHLVVQRDTGRLDGDATVRLILPSVRQPHISGGLLGNDSSSSHQGIR
uniref:Uncharacterized protein n=1 Tax=Physcomitrium patens TaxID=3218 RepID=A0A2K1JW97_PHYPA|nr:hypothetical protein PHYPA_015562 [Physcomitrium patens]